MAPNLSTDNVVTQRAPSKSLPHRAFRMNDEFWEYAIITSEVGENPHTSSHEPSRAEQLLLL